MILDCNSEWANFCLDTNNYVNEIQENTNNEDSFIPKCSDIYISTKTMIAYLSSKIDIIDVFWKLVVMDYSTPSDGIIKKQIKLSFTNENAVKSYKDLIINEKIVVL